MQEQKAAKTPVFISSKQLKHLRDTKSPHPAGPETDEWHHSASGPVCKKPQTESSIKTKQPTSAAVTFNKSTNQDAVLAGSKRRDSAVHYVSA